ncbi:MAG: fatty acid desaturase [Rhodobiaceae bacterium]|nr:fatty acid desaturase [Rhodobiaceae bacterium]
MSQPITPLSQALGENALVPRRDLKKLMKRSNRPGLVHLAGWVALLLATGSLVRLAGDTWWWLVPAMFVHGIVMVHHFALQHECSHYTAFRSRWLCDLMATICGFLLVIPPRFFRYEHCDHHTYTNLHGRDPELIELPISLWKYLAFLSSVPYWYGNVEGLVRRAFGRLTDEEKRFIPKVEHAAVVRESRAFIAGYAAIAVIMIATGWIAPLFYWVFPMLLGQPVMRFIRMTEHVGRPNVADMRENTRTNVVSWPWRFLAWNMNYHAEHHYAASVPFYALADLHEKIRDHVYVEKHGYLSAHIDIISQMIGRKPRLATTKEEAA